ncbi:DUF2953 domain-containing protein [Konateibacter massiliensis]|uniref:DUF2953 domain-containing protein n=1 Tax=Konateibacter massiliensis TaxID=2002841 RepID=UPI000C1491DC|nr:DUF2953 domain-containing protein [Konateibacter massiliensis]
MLHVLLVILKIIGIVLLALLLLVLFLLALVLFVPVRYQAYAVKGTEMHAKVNASWLLHFLHFKLYWDEEGLTNSFRILGIPVESWKSFFGKIKVFFTGKKRTKKGAKKKPKEKRRRQADKDKPEIKQISQPDEDKPEAGPTDEAVSEEKQAARIDADGPEIKEISRTGEDKQEKKPEDKIKGKAEEKVPVPKAKKRKINFSIKKIIDKIKRFFQAIKNFWNKMKQIAKNIREKLREVQEFLTDEGNRQAFSLAKDQLIIALKHIRPRKYKVNLKFGTGDPALTGQILGIFGMLMPLYKNNAHIVPDFEETVLEGDVYMRGRVTLARLLLIGWKLYRDENVKRCYKMIMD